VEEADEIIGYFGLRNGLPLMVGYRERRWFLGKLSVKYRETLTFPVIYLLT
jgi:hypothetical protein